LTASVHGRRVNTNRFQAIPISVIILFLPPSSYPSNIPSSTPATFLLSLALLVLLCDPTGPSLSSSVIPLVLPCDVPLPQIITHAYLQQVGDLSS